MIDKGDTVVVDWANSRHGGGKYHPLTAVVTAIGKGYALLKAASGSVWIADLADLSPA
jgi:hypothetical protein